MFKLEGDSQQGDRHGDSDDIVLITGSHLTSVARVGLGAQGFTHAVSASPHDDPVRAASVCPSPDPLPRPGPARRRSQPGRSGTMRRLHCVRGGGAPCRRDLAQQASASTTSTLWTRPLEIRGVK